MTIRPISLSELLSLPHHIIDIQKGEYIFREGETTNELYIVCKGKVQLSKTTEEGRELLLRICEQGDAFGEIVPFQLTCTCTVSAKMMETGTLAVINKQQLEEKLLIDHVFALQFMQWIHLQLQRMQTKIRDLILHGKKGALYSTLIRLANSYGVETDDGILIDFPMTNQELANFCGSAREVVSRLLKELKELEIISVEKGKITIHDVQFLKDEIRCEGCPIDICNMK
ncbi:CRP/FNR family transcriptional regulator [Anoxybacillus tengchongensis]|uniref:CRP/FNR family transcriptional regulator n=1 Tax=Anoxybacillus tengchongensis TaxID=576944 RepID=A0A7X0D9J4_9BACL|nr:Crp/Fnr family transcriptional regulator [Anoxybacillus tengchongensis]MBB6176718.1 CRP/FNR family transcriptional regulator [Anoxybacillus tengchongensis]